MTEQRDSETSTAGRAEALSTQGQSSARSRFSEQDRRFLRSARDAAHRCLWWLGGVHETGHERTDSDLRQALGWRAQQAWATISDRGLPPSLSESPEGVAWSKFQAAVEGLATTPQLRSVHVAEQLGRAFLKVSLSLHRRPWVTHWPKNAVRYLQAHAAGLLMLSASLWVSLTLPQLSGLLMEARVPALVFVSIFVAGLVVAMWAGRSHLGRHQRVRHIDVLGPAFRRFREQAIPPRRGVQRYAKSDPLVSVLRRANFMRLLLVIGGLAVAGLAALIWCEVSGEELVRTVFAALALFYVLFCVGVALDFWVYMDGRPLRALSLAVVAVSALLMDRPGGAFLLLLLYAVLAFGGAALGIAAHLRQDMDDRNAAWTVGAIMFFAFGYVGTNHISQGEEAWLDAPAGELPNPKGVDVARVSTQQWPARGRDPVVVVVASGGGSRAAIYTALALRQMHHETPEIACAIQAIASVSGGSLANAAYMQRRWKGRAELCGQGKADLTELDEMVNAVAGDFIWPTMTGVWLYQTRGRTLEEAWEDGEVGLEDTTLEEIARQWNPRRLAGPLPLFNTTNLERHAVVLSPLGHEAFVDMAQREHALSANAYDAPGIKAPTWVYYRDAIYGVDELVPKRPIRLSEAVRASANFPFGFPLVQLISAAPHQYSPDKSRRRGTRPQMRLTDGGALSNSGLWSMFHLLENHEAQLAERGVVLVVVEASHMPEYKRPGRFFGVADTISDQPPLGQALHREMFEVLSRRLGDRFALVQLELTAEVGDNVETTWALPQRRVEDLTEVFKREWTGATRPAMKQRLERAMSSTRRAAAACAIDPQLDICGGQAAYQLRPPLD